MKIIYSDAYEVDIGAHVFPTVKFRLIRERLLREKLTIPQECIEAPEAKDDHILLVHTKEYLQKLTRGTLSPEELHTLELPFSHELVHASRVCVGGTICSAEYAIEEGCSAHLGGGFHHAFADRGEGFCVLNDVAVAAEFCKRFKGIEKVMIVDCDLHQGNGNADIFKNDNQIFTFSIHQQNNYPLRKPPSDIDIGLTDGSGDDAYLDALNNTLPELFRKVNPQLIFYIAGADPYYDDQLGRLALSLKGLEKRDELVFSLVRKHGIKCCVVFGGGYARNIVDTVNIHYATVKKAIELLGVKGGARK